MEPDQICLTSKITMILELEVPVVLPIPLYSMLTTELHLTSKLDLEELIR